MSSSYTEPEVLAPERWPANIPDFGRMVEQVRVLWQEYQQVEHRAVRIAVVLGLMLEAWREGTDTRTMIAAAEAAGMGRRPMFRFIELARAVREQMQLAGGDAQALLAGEPKAEQMLMEFIGDRTQQELYAELGIKGGSASRDRGGNMALLAWLRDHHPHLAKPGVTLRDLPAAVRAEWERHIEAEAAKVDGAARRAEVAEEFWTRLCHELHEDIGHHRLYALLPPAQLKLVSTRLLDARRAIEDCIRKG